MTYIVLLGQMAGDPAFYGELSAELLKRYPGSFDFQFYEISNLDQDPELFKACMESAERSDLLLLDLHSGLTHFSGFKGLRQTVAGKKKMFIRSGIEDEVTALMDELGIGIAQYAEIDRYMRAGGIENYISLALYIANQFSGADYDIPEPDFGKWQGLYEPGGLAEDETAYLSRARNTDLRKVGVIVHEHQLRSGDMAAADALYRGLLRAGAQPVILVTNVVPPGNTETLGFSDALRRYFTEDGKAAVDVIINTTGMSLSVLSAPGNGSAPKSESVFEAAGIPVLQAMRTFYSYEQWVKAPAGVDSMMLSAGVYQPEFDGQIITFPISASEIIQTPFGVRRVSVPIAERVEKVCKLAVNWARLRGIPAADKKVAVIFHNIPPRNDSIGCAHGLDTPASVYNMLRALESEGVRFEYPFEDGKDIIGRIIDGLTNDGRWLTEEKMLERSCDTVPAAMYGGWFDSFGEPVREKMIEDWGEPPGTFMAVEDKLLIPGLINGNVFIGLQPPRAIEEKAEEAYHSTDFVCPHQYIAYYKWIEQVFKADVIVHVGTHGTLEWLPGKEIGLSDVCYPDLAIGCLPHLYVYNINVTGEGMQAKRRGYAALIGHMVPSMTESGVYGELAEMDDLIDGYYHARQAAPKELPVLYEQIWELAVRLNLDKDLNMTEKPRADADSMNEFVEKLHLWVSRIKASEVRDGLHILGEAPVGERFSNLCKLLVRVRNGEVPSLREGICEKRGLDLNDLIDNGKDILPDGRTKRMLLEEVDGEGRALFQALSELDFDASRVRELAPDGKLFECLSYACGHIAANLRRMGDEIGYFMKGIRDEFISPGPSGNPSRGNAAVLPTGRNFYSIDPGALPSRTAWLVGNTLAKQMLEREIAETGDYPESVAIVIFAGDTMKTCGEDLAEALFLMGVKPVWLGNTDRVIGMEVIPLEELGRPRIDVTLRISGLFRDTFPNMIERIEDAVNLAAALDEPHSQNYMRKHIDEEVLQMTAEGTDIEQARERASARIFGCPPGTYGGGVDTLINSRQWTSNEDLGSIYVQWSGHAYGRKLHGAMFQEQLRTRLGKTSVTIKNESSVELDILEYDDQYIYHGGLIAAVRAASGRIPNSYTAASADTDHVETSSIREETARVMRSRINNPKWREGLRRHGYKGALDIAQMVDYVFGWDATTESVQDWMYDEITKNFVLDRETRDWISEANPWAMQAITERLLEAAQRGMWNADDDMLQKLKDIYMDAEGTIEEGL